MEDDIDLENVGLDAAEISRIFADDDSDDDLRRKRKSKKKRNYHDKITGEFKKN